MIVALTIVGFVVVGLTAGLFLTASAPLGYQDDSGFHYGQPDGKLEEEIPVGIPQPKLA